MFPRLDLARAQVLITGGGHGIGLALATRFLALGARVLVTGRGESTLLLARRAHPGLETFVSDVSVASQRKQLVDHVAENLPALNIVINNAGIQRRVALAADNAPWSELQAEIDTLLAGPVHLNQLLVPKILAHGQPAMIVNVTSGGAYLPQPFAPVYSACKAAMHSITVNLRYALSETPCRVVELIPPAVRTGLGGSDLGHGVPLDDFANAVFQELGSGDKDEIGYGPTSSPRFEEAARPYREMFADFRTRSPVKLYGE